MVAHQHNNAECCPDPECGLHDPKQYRRFHEALKKGMDEGLVKVGLPVDKDGVDGPLSYEWVWGIPLEGNQVVVNNIPVFCSAVSLHDIIETDSDDEFRRTYVRTISEMTNKILFQYPDDRVNAAKNYAKIFNFFQRDCGLYVSGMFPGVGALAFPVEKDFHEIMDLIEQFNDENDHIFIPMLEDSPDGN